MANAAIYKELGGFLADKSGHAILIYDFANDAGAQGTIDLGEAKQKMCIKNAYIHVQTACTSAGSATVSIGSTDDADGILDTTSGAVANLTADAVLFETTDKLFLDVGDKISLVIGTADLTAGKIAVHLDLDILA